MADDPQTTDMGWDELPQYGEKTDDAVTVSVSTAPGEWLVNTSDAVVVPMSMSEVVEALQSGKLTERSLVWRAGMQEWAPVDRVPQLKLAARLPLAPSVPAPASAPARSTAASHPAAAAPPKPRPPSQPVNARPSSPHAATQPPSRKSTLPFGTPAPVSSPPRPGFARASHPSLAAAATLEPIPVPTEPREEPGVLAVYERPAATISFELPAPEQQVEGPRPAEPEAPRPPRTPSVPPHSLVPTTADASPRSMPAPRNADLSVVAAAQFRQVQRSSKRLVLISSVASAAAASLLTFALSRSNHEAPAPALDENVAAARPAEPVPSAAPVVEAPAPSAVASAATPPSAAAAPSAPPKPKARRARAVAPRPARPPADASASGGISIDPNPYDVKLEDDAPSEKSASAPTATHGSGLESNAPTTPATGADTPGF